MEWEICDSNTPITNIVKILVSGAHGFIGRSLLKVFNEKDVNIFAIIKDIKKSNLIKNINYIEHTISHNNELVFEKAKYDTLIHLSWSSLNDYNSINHMQNDLAISYNFVKQAIDSGIKNILIAGTCFEYGNIEGQVSETDNTCPINEYSKAKNELRKKIESIQRNKQFNLTWMRIFYVYGDEQSRNSLYKQLTTAVLEKKKYFQVSAGEQKKDYLHVDDLANKIKKLSMTNKNVGIVNVCSGNPISIKDLVKKWIAENQWSIIPKFGELESKKSEQNSFWGNVKKYNKIIKK